MQEKNEINSNFASFCAFYKKISKIMKELNDELAKTERLRENDTCDILL
ncbi:MAG: hypothetical protein J6J43_07850 [Oscillospiraceae bacterium]|nr:hypothetical protein [Oscillospiraceae bacterium]